MTGTLVSSAQPQPQIGMSQASTSSSTSTHPSEPKYRSPSDLSTVTNSSSSSHSSYNPVISQVGSYSFITPLHAQPFGQEDDQIQPFTTPGSPHLLSAVSGVRDRDNGTSRGNQSVVENQRERERESEIESESESRWGERSILQDKRTTTNQPQSFSQENRHASPDPSNRSSVIEPSWDDSSVIDSHSRRGSEASNQFSRSPEEDDYEDLNETNQKNQDLVNRLKGIDRFSGREKEIGSSSDSFRTSNHPVFPTRTFSLGLENSKNRKIGNGNQHLEDQQRFAREERESGSRTSFDQSSDEKVGAILFNPNNGIPKNNFSESRTQDQLTEGTSRSPTTPKVFVKNLETSSSDEVEALRKQVGELQKALLLKSLQKEDVKLTEREGFHDNSSTQGRNERFLNGEMVEIELQRRERDRIEKEESEKEREKERVKLQEQLEQFQMFQRLQSLQSHHQSFDSPAGSFAQLLTQDSHQPEPSHYVHPLSQSHQHQHSHPIQLSHHQHQNYQPSSQSSSFFSQSPSTSTSTSTFRNGNGMGMSISTANSSVAPSLWQEGDEGGVYSLPSASMVGASSDRQLEEMGRKIDELKNQTGR